MRPGALAAVQKKFGNTPNRERTSSGKPPAVRATSLSPMCKPVVGATLWHGHPVVGRRPEASGRDRYVDDRNHPGDRPQDFEDQRSPRPVANQELQEIALLGDR